MSLGERGAPGEQPRRRAARARWARWPALLALVALGLGLLVALSFHLGYLASLPVPIIEQVEDLESIRRLLVVAPHCDDEVIAAGGLIQGVLAAGGEVRVALLTNGDGSFTGTQVEYRKLYPTSRDYVHAGTARQQESLNALAALGLDEDHVFFLSYPDRGIAALWETYWRDSAPYQSPFTRFVRSPYQRTYNPNAVYSGQSLLGDLSRILVEFAPDTVLSPHPHDDHPDHWAGGAFTNLAVARLGEQDRPRVLLYLVHRASFPVPRGYLPYAPLLPPLALVNDSCAWSIAPLSEEAIERKAAAVGLYRSQLALIGKFLWSFVRQNEAFCEMAPYQARPLARATGPNPADWEAVDGEEILIIAQDSTRDTLPKELGPAGDFVSLRLAQVNGELWVAAEVRAKASSLLSYACTLHAASDDQVIVAQRAFPPRITARSQDDAQANFVLARFSLAELGNPHTVLVSFRSRYPGGATIDRVGWALATLAP